jgi:microsomal dipeptidase-like Zn-dependent dipeptidase
MPFVWLVVLAFCGGTGVSAILWLTTLPPLPNCQRLHFLSSDNERLYCAEQAARSGKADAMLAGLKLIKHWTAEHPQFRRTQQLMRDWSKSVMNAAYHKISQEDLNGAIAFAQGIPPISPTYQEAQRAIAAWQQDQQRSKAFEDIVQAALKAQNWTAVEAQLDQLSKLEGILWQQKHKRLKQALITEQLARRQVQQVRRLVDNQPTSPEAIGQLIAVLDEIRPQSYARPEAVIELKRLHPLLMAALNQRLAQSDLAAAIAAAQRFSKTLPPPPEAHDILWFNQAQALATRQFPAQPVQQLTQIWLVLPRLRQVKPGQPLHPHAQALAKQLEQQMQNIHQIQLADSVAAVGQAPTFQLAIDLAQLVPLGNPYRIYAQTLIADWRKSRQLAEDRPYLVQASQLANGKTASRLRAAIAVASRVGLGRPLRLEAQTAIADWNQRAQTLEEQDFLKQAQALARQKKWEQAIKLAGKIGVGRALHAQAQTDIQNWTKQLQIAQDRPILDRAIAMANQSKLEAAITYASQIPLGRALYEETQAAIATWQAKLDATLAARSPESNPPSPELNTSAAPTEN